VNLRRLDTSFAGGIETDVVREGGRNGQGFGGKGRDIQPLRGEESEQSVRKGETTQTR
jgi:hypothetical protein